MIAPAAAAGSAPISPPSASTAAAAGPTLVKVLELETIRQWCRACGRATPTVTESNEKTYCYVCHNGEDSPDDY